MATHTYKKSQISQLKVFVAVVECENNMTRAAEKINSTSSSVSGKITSLEKDLGYQLFIRKGKRILSLTENGIKLYEKAIESVNALNKIYETDEIVPIKIKKASKIETLILFCSRYLFIKFKKMIIKIKVTHLMTFSAVFLFGLYLLCAHRIDNSFMEKKQIIVTNIVKND